tara:strand:+ start:156 stop:641 length:486 start_codon:yes stop_codon:yes gene_type:complete
VLNQELRELYQEVIIDHGRHPRNFRVPEQYNHSREGYNPLCGDRLKLFMMIGSGDAPVIEDIAFTGAGCAISMASASLLTEGLKGKTQAEAEALFDHFHGLVTGQQQTGADGLGKLRVLLGVRAFPSRIKCATLAWHTLMAALSDEGRPDVALSDPWVTTE